MNINWYPGHMTKSIRMIREYIPLIDVIVYVLDLRAPLSCINPDFDEIIGNLPVIFVLNKSDLASVAEVDEWVAFFNEGKNVALALNGTLKSAAKFLLPAIRRAAQDKLAKYREKGINKSVRAMVIGVPNSGKSTLINSLCGSKKTITGDKPGVTRGQQWVRIDGNLEILDTPGTLYPKISDQTAARRLAYIGSIRDAVVDSYELATDFIKEVGAEYPSFFARRYGLNDFSDTEKVLDAVGRSRGYLLKGGAVDLDRAAVAVIDDFRKGRLGKITLDKNPNLI